MDTFNSVRDDILQVGKDLSGLFSKVKSIPGMSDHSFEDWESICNRIQKQIQIDIIRVAVVGPIKSGKSTFINALLKGDYLRRGAGVVTSIVTRIHKGSTQKATLYFKSWDDVNADIDQTVVLLPLLQGRSEIGRFDIRREKDRGILKNAIDDLGSELVLETGILNASCVLISNYLKGYEEIKDFVGVENKRVEYSDGNFAEHKTFVGDDSLSVYLKDIQLEIDSEILEENIEIADCQGSDSPNPLHLAMIQDYLVLAHFIVYVVSSRIGLREADIRFLSMIKKMGILDNILFIVNFDFSEHDSVNDLNALVEKIRQEISIIRPHPKLFTLSSLFNLFKSQKTSLTHKDNERLAQWLSLEVFSNSSVQEGKRFLKTFSQQIVNERFSLLLKNHLERLGVMATGMDHWISINQDILSGDLNNAHKFLVKIKQHEEKIGHIKLLIRDTLDGAVQKLIDELKGEIDRFFSARSGEVVSNLLEFIRNYRVSYVDYGKKMEVSGFNNTLYLIFQDFKHAIDRFITESINPQIIKFIREKEDHISKFLESVSLPYERMVLDTLDDYNDTVKDFGILPIHVNHKPIEAPNMDSVKQVIGLKLPLAEATMRYSAKIKTGAIIHFGAYKMVNLIKKLFKKPVQNQREEAILALKGGVDRMKRETEKAMAYHFKNYRENIKFQYILRLVEGASNYFFDELKNRFQIYLTDLSQLIALVDDKGTSKEGTAGTLQEMEIMAKEIIQRVGQMRQRVESPTQ